MKVWSRKEARGALLANFERGLKLATPILRERDGTDVEHAGDIFATAVMRDPSILVVLGALDDEDAIVFLRETFTQLERADAALFELPPSREAFARLSARALQNAAWPHLSEDTRSYYTATAERSRVGDRRRAAYDFRQRVAARKAAAQAVTETTAPDIAEASA